MVGNCKCNFTITNKHSFRILLLVDGGEMSAEILRQEGEERNSCSAKMKGILSIAPNQSSMGRHLGGIKTTFQQLCHPQGDQKMSSQLNVISTLSYLSKAKSSNFQYFSDTNYRAGEKNWSHFWKTMSHLHGFVALTLRLCHICIWMGMSKNKGKLPILHKY